MNTSAKILMATLVFLSILIFWNQERVMTSLVAGLVVFMALQWKGPK